MADDFSSTTWAWPPPGMFALDTIGSYNPVTSWLTGAMSQIGFINIRNMSAGDSDLETSILRDVARYQKCALVQALAASLGIELLYLPGYSPNLNLIERLWRLVRKESLDSTYYEAFEQFTTAIDQCLDGLPTIHKGEMETLLTHKFQTFGNVPLLAA